MATEKKSPGRPKKPIPVYITASYVVTSDGPKHHGDAPELPPDEAGQLVNKGWAKWL